MATIDPKGPRLFVCSVVTDKDSWVRKRFGDSADEAQVWIDIPTGEHIVEITRGDESLDGPIWPAELELSAEGA